MIRPVRRVNSFDPVDPTPGPPADGRCHHPRRPPPTGRSRSDRLGRGPGGAALMVMMSGRQARPRRRRAGWCVRRAGAVELTACRLATWKRLNRRRGEGPASARWREAKQKGAGIAASPHVAGLRPRVRRTYGLVSAACSTRAGKGMRASRRSPGPVHARVPGNACAFRPSAARSIGHYQGAARRSLSGCAGRSGSVGRLHGKSGAFSSSTVRVPSCRLRDHRASGSSSGLSAPSARACAPASGSEAAPLPRPKALRR